MLIQLRFFYNSLAYAVLGFKALGEAVPNSEAVCKKLQEMSSSAEAASGGVNTAYQLAAASKALQPACKVTLNEKLTQVAILQAFLATFWAS